jgi:calpain-7
MTSSTPSTSIDDVFEFLSLAEQLEPMNPIEAATKYYEAVYLMRQYMQRIPSSSLDSYYSCSSPSSRINHSNSNHVRIKLLLNEKIVHYEKVATALLQRMSPSSTGTTNQSSMSALSLNDDNLPRSPLSTMIPTPHHPDSNANHLSPSSMMAAEQRGTNSHTTTNSSRFFSNDGHDDIASSSASSCRTTISTPLVDSVATTDPDKIIHQANTKLSQAMDYDECKNNGNDNNSEKNYDRTIQMYMNAAELYLKAIQLLSSKQPPPSPESNSLNGANTTKDMAKKRLQQTLDRVEVLKQKQRSSSTTSKTKQPQPNNFHRKASMFTTSSSSSTKFQTNSTTTRQEPPPSTSSYNNNFTKDEIEILKQSSLIASGLFLPWSDQDAKDLAKECRTQRTTLYTDPDGFLSLSSMQKEQFHCWARPNEVLRVRQQHTILSSVKRTSKVHPDPIITKTITPYTIQQKYITDCSFIASLCICANYEQRFGKKIITSILHPQDENGMVIYNPYGKYMVKLWFNGVPRCVVIDDYLPIDKYGNLLCSQTSYSSNTNNSSLELWVCLIEKAYMKLCGGYDFPGSNSGVDLFSLTGWIPERIHFSNNSTNPIQDHETPSERAWERIYSASAYGDCLITVSTQVDITEEAANTVGLVTGHAYAVLAVIQTKNGTRLLQLKNPWAHKGWKGRYSCYDKHSWASPSFRKEVGYDHVIASQQDDGVFWIGWDDILHYFRNFHLSWNPALFRSRFVLHGHWSKHQGPTDDTFNIGENPQYAVTLSDVAIQKKATLWILISRHVTKQEQEGEEVCVLHR